MCEKDGLLILCVTCAALRKFRVLGYNLRRGEKELAEAAAANPIPSKSIPVNYRVLAYVSGMEVVLSAGVVQFVGDEYYGRQLADVVRALLPHGFEIDTCLIGKDSETMRTFLPQTRLTTKSGAFSEVRVTWSPSLRPGGRKKKHSKRRGSRSRK